MSIFWKALGEKYALKIELDNHASNPREEMDGWLGTMVCWHRRYTLGDKHDHSEPRDFLCSLAREYENTPEAKRILRKAQQKYFKGFTIVKDITGRWQIMNGADAHWPYRWWGTKHEAAEYLKEYKQEWLERAIDDELSLADLKAIIAPHAVVLQLYLYDHSGISMSCSSFIGRAHHAEWDSGPVGYICASKEKFLKETGYSEYNLFGEKVRPPRVGDFVNVKGREADGMAKIVDVMPGKKVTVDWNFRYAADFQKPERAITVPNTDIIPVFNYAEKMLENEVEVYDQYLRGEVYGFKLYSVDRNELGDYMIENDIQQDDIAWDDLEQFFTETDSGWGFYGDDHEKNGIADNLPEEARPLVKDLQIGRIEERITYRYA